MARAQTDMSPNFRTNSGLLTVAWSIIHFPFELSATFFGSLKIESLAALQTGLLLSICLLYGRFALFSRRFDVKVLNFLNFRSRSSLSPDLGVHGFYLQLAPVHTVHGTRCSVGPTSCVTKSNHLFSPNL